MTMISVGDIYVPNGCSILISLLSSCVFALCT